MNNFSGHLPSSIGHWLPNLEVLYLWGNILEGIIPSSISNASMLTKIELDSNCFSGTIPNTLGNLWCLENLILENNFLARESSSLELSFLSPLTNCSLISIVLADNPLNGTLPTSIGNFSTSLEEFVASNCNIKGTIPMGIGNLSNLNILSLENNELVGPSPTTIRGMNNLQGEIPKSLIELTFLKYFNVSFNRLQGKIPFEGVIAQFSAQSFMGNQALCGPP
uniref:Uncharacterized protein n=1 Tax=Quercus lobata TaxID=97700 RepID=A0A7N2MVJ3_QUELO